MALEIYDEFAPRATAPSAEFVGGSIKGESVSGANDGTLLKAILINDYVGFTDALLAEAKMTLTGDVDTALNSQRLTAIKYIIDARSAARALGLSDTAVLVGEAGLTTTASNTHVLNVVNKLTYLLPLSVGTGETIVSMTDNTLVTSGGTYYLQSTGAVNKVASSVLVNSDSAVLAGGMVTITSGYFMFTDGMDANGFNVNTETFTGAVDFTGVGSGTYWVGRVAGGGWTFRTDKPVFNLTTGLFTGETEPLSFLKNAVVLLSSVPQSFGVDSIPENNTVSITGVIVTGTATFDNATQAINMTGVGAIAGLEVGDVIKIEGSASNNGFRTIEDITSDGEVIVNYEHRGQTTTMALVDETSAIGVTITLLCKWYNAALGLGQGWCVPSSSRSVGAIYTNSMSRLITANVSYAGGGQTVNSRFYVDGIVVSDQLETTTIDGTLLGTTTASVPGDSEYNIPAAIELGNWVELR